MKFDYTTVGFPRAKNSQRQQTGWVSGVVLPSGTSAGAVNSWPGPPDTSSAGCKCNSTYYLEGYLFKVRRKHVFVCKPRERGCMERGIG